MSPFASFFRSWRKAVYVEAVNVADQGNFRFGD